MLIKFQDPKGNPRGAVAEFERWRRNHPNGYVLNVYLDGTKLHHAGCAVLNDKAHIGSSTRRLKVGADRAQELVHYAETHLNGGARRPKPCGACKPAVTGPSSARDTPRQNQSSAARAALNTKTLHIVQGDTTRDKKWLERASGRGLVEPTWIVPKSVKIGDEVVIYIAGLGFFATGRITTAPRRRIDQTNRYGAGLGSVRLIVPPVSLAILRKRLPALKWVNYPRSITTPRPEITERIRQLIAKRRRRRASEIGEEELKGANLAELRALARARSSPRASASQRLVTQRKREAAIKAYAIARANGRCEFCRHNAPFLMENGSAYLESHHILRLADDGPDDPRNVLGICPNCHRRAHFAHDRKQIKARMKRRAAVLERRAAAG